MMIKSFAKTDKDNQFKTTIIHWLWHFTKNIEYYDQEVDSYNKLLAFVALAEKDTEFSEGLVSNTSKFLRESFYPYLPLLSLRSYHAVYCGNVCESCWVESDNAALKTFRGGSRSRFLSSLDTGGVSVSVSMMLL